MFEGVDERKVYSLSEVTRSIQETLTERYTGSFWVKAEMNKLNHYPQSGHCYPELVEKSNGKIIAEMRSTIWKDDFERINENFLKILREPLKSGVNILFCAKINFHPVYGLSLRIIDIDPSYSLGELEKEKQETIGKLKKEGIFYSNKSLDLALLPKRIAVISAQTSKGYADFLNILEGNSWGYRFFHMMFQAYLQGENAIESITAQLNRIKKVKQHFDAVAIIRGGGGDIGLTCYNNYLLSKEIALFPLPVITGIGHSTNETVAEMVSFKNAITPTELADFLIQQFHNFAVPLQKAQESIAGRSERLLVDEKVKLIHSVRFFRSAATTSLINRKNDIRDKIKSLVLQTDHFFQRKRQILESKEKNVELMNPVNVLKRGYSLTMANGKVLQQVEGIKEGDILETILRDGMIVSKVRSVKRNEQLTETS